MRKTKATPGIFSPRRRVLKLGAAVALAPGMLPGIVMAQTRQPVRIGFLTSFSKAFAFLGESNLNGFMLYLDQVGAEVAGRKIEVIREDDEITPQVGLQKLRKLVERNNVDIVCGPQASNVAMAILGYVKQSKTFLVVNGAGIRDLAYERVPYLFRTSLTTWQVSAPMADWVFDSLTKEIVLTASDFAGGRDVIRQFKAAYEKRGGKVIKEIYPPLGNADFSPYLADIRSIAPPATYNFYAGTDAVRFVRQYTELGLKQKIPMTGYASLVDADTFEGQGQSALGVITGNIYSDALENSANKAFVSAYRAKYKAFPNLYSVYGYTTARVIVETLKLTGGDTNKDKVSAAMRSVKFEDPRGPFRFDPVTNTPIQNLYILTAAMVDGRLTNKMDRTLTDIRDPGVKDS